MPELTVFPTAIGACGLAWQDSIVVAAHLPEASEAETRAKLSARAGGAIDAAPPPVIQVVIAAMVELLAGRRVDLRDVRCDYGRADDLAVRVYDLTRAVPPGQTITYGEIATQLGDKRLAQAVGGALGRNPLPIIVPCHRVLGADGKLTGFSANGGVSTKLRMLEIEGAAIARSGGLFDDLPLSVKPAGPATRNR